MAWRSLQRRNPSRSMTVVGDLAQRSGHRPAASWEQVLGRGRGRHVREAVLTISYRTPATVMDTASAVLAEQDMAPRYPVRAARDLPGALATTTVDADTLAATTVAVVREELAALDAADGTGIGRLAVVVPAGHDLDVLGDLAAEPDLAGALVSDGQDPLGARVAVLDPVAAKGLEFDVVVLLEPAAVLEAGPGDLYVAMTRPTRRLHVVHARPLPAGFR